MPSLIERAEAFATRHHDGIFRKYEVPPEPYIEHPKRVAKRFARLHIAQPDMEIGTATGYTHDTLEDKTKDGHYITFDNLAEATSYEVALLTQELTNPSKQFPDLPRPDRKKMDRDHIGHVSDIAKLLKLIDRPENLRDLAKETRAPLSFRRIYLGESELLLEAIGTVNYPDYIQLRLEYIEALDAVRRSLS